MTKACWGGEGLLAHASTLLSIIKGYQGRNSKRVETWRQELLNLDGPSFLFSWSLVVPPKLPCADSAQNKGRAEESLQEEGLESTGAVHTTVSEERADKENKCHLDAEEES